jgi:outer membrane protein OmpA-like peptidoglycan-associated protein
MDCANMNVRIEGWASPNERSATDLSTERAQAVEAYYIENGVAASRIVTQGNGAAGDAGTKDGASQYRRVDSVPTLDN